MKLICLPILHLFYWSLLPLSPGSGFTYFLLTATQPRLRICLTVSTSCHFFDNWSNLVNLWWLTGFDQLSKKVKTVRNGKKVSSNRVSSNCNLSSSPPLNITIQIKYVERTSFKVAFQNDFYYQGTLFEQRTFPSYIKFNLKKNCFFFFTKTEQF